MSRELINAICAGLPAAEVSDPWGGGHDAWKVGGKLFAIVGALTPSVSVKTDSIETAEMLISVGVAGRAAYLHCSWVLLSPDAGEEELRGRITHSYRIVRGGLSRKAQAALPPFEP